MEIVEKFLTDNPCFRSGKRIAVRGLMLHSVGCSQPSAKVFMEMWNRPDAPKVCVHAFIDGNTGTVYQTLPWDYRGWHGGGKANNTHIGVEMCEPGCIRYGSGAAFVCSDREEALAMVNRTYHTAVELFAFLCRQFSLNPMEDGVIISHKEGYARGIASGHVDPEHLWDGLQSGFTMEGFRRDVNAAMAAGGWERPEIAVRQEHLAKQNMFDGKMHISDRGVDLIAGYEGCRLEAYLCPAGVWTIGYGHTEGVKAGDRLSSKEEAKKLLKRDLEKYGGYVNDFVEKGKITFSLNQNQFDALTSFCYNCGRGNLQKLVSGRDADTVAQKMLLYNKGAGKVLPGLKRRREEESALFMRGEYHHG